MEPRDVSAESIASTHATEERFERLVETLRARDTGVTFDTLYDRAVVDIARETHHPFDEESSIDLAALRSAVAARTRAFLDSELE